MLRQVQSDRSNLAHGWLPFAADSIRQQFGTQMPQGGHPPHQKLVRKAFYACTPAEGTPEQMGRFRRQKFLAALDWAEQNQLIGAGDIKEVSCLWLARPEPEEDDQELD